MCDMFGDSPPPVAALLLQLADAGKDITLKGGAKSISVRPLTVLPAVFSGAKRLPVVLKKVRGWEVYAVNNAKGRKYKRVA